jgi:hypothetical protein
VIGRVLGLMFGFAAAVILVSLAVANRHGVLMVLDPFNPQDPVIAIDLPLYAYLLAMLLFGVLLGGVATWISQGKWRRMARVRTQEALRWKAEAERLTRERDATAALRKQPALAGR